jgi:CRP-like cAMP-binding protein
MAAEGPRTETENRLLRALPRRERERLRPKLEPVRLAVREQLYDAGKPIAHVYFPTDCVLSMVADVDGESVEVATVGNEGMAGLPVFLGTGTIPSKCYCQVPGDALRMRAAALEEEVGCGGALRDVLLRYTHYLLTQATQSAACNRLHSAEERLCRWLLMTQDRAGSDRFPLTQEFMALLLGVRRATVSLTASALQHAGLIKYSRGKVTVLDREGLEGASCGCYAVVRKELERLLG